MIYPSKNPELQKLIVKILKKNNNIKIRQLELLITKKLFNDLYNGTTKFDTDHHTILDEINWMQDHQMIAEIGIGWGIKLISETPKNFIERGYY